MSNDRLAAGFRVNPPDDELPAVLDVRAILGRTDDVIVGIVGGDLYSSGFTLRLAVRCRVPLVPPDRLNHIAGRLAEDSKDQAQDGLDLSIHYRLASIRPSEPEVKRRAGFRHIMSSGRNLAVDIELWVSPRPELNELVIFMLNWPQVGINSSDETIDGSEFALTPEGPIYLWRNDPHNLKTS